MKPFRERNPVPIGIAGTLALLMFMMLTVFAKNIPVFNGGGQVYKANFVEAANLQKDREVRIAGVKVGKVLNVELVGDHVVVSFRLKQGTSVPRLTRASIKVKSLTGSEYLSLEPEGNGQLDNKAPIPVSRTTSPFEVIPAFQGLANDHRGHRHQAARAGAGRREWRLLRHRAERSGSADRALPAVAGDRRTRRRVATAARPRPQRDRCARRRGTRSSNS